MFKIGDKVIVSDPSYISSSHRKNLMNRELIVTKIGGVYGCLAFEDGVFHVSEAFSLVPKQKVRDLPEWF